MQSYFARLYKSSKSTFVKELQSKVVKEEKCFVVTANPEIFMLGRRERKVDEEKKRFLLDMKALVEGLGGVVTEVKNEAEFSYTFGENNYTVKLVKHRKKDK